MSRFFPEPLPAHPSCTQVADGPPLRVRRQKRFTNLEGAAEPMGDLKVRLPPRHCHTHHTLSVHPVLVQSVVLHDMKATHIKSTFPCSLGARVTGVDDKTYSSTGEAFSAIVLPMAESTRDKALQSDDVSL